MKRLSILLLSVLCTAATTFAYDFQSGDLYYNITSENTVEVTYQEYWSSTNYQGLTTASIPATVTYNGTTYSVTSIGEEAFRYCSSLTSITIPNSVTSIGTSAFYYCSALSSITIPNSVTSIGGSAFYGCSALPVVDNLRYADTYLVEAVDKSLSSYTIKAGTKWIGYKAFYECTSITSITIPNSVTNIGGYAFRGCSSLTSITIPNSVTSIGRSAFEDCSSLTSITIPNSVTRIGDWTFSGCSSLRDITCLAVIPPTCGSNVFEEVPYDATLWCPCESKEAYQAADGWSRFNDIRPSNFPQTTLLTDSERGHAQIDEWICEPQSVVISATPYEGYVLTRWSDGNTDNPRTVLLTKDTTLTAEFGLAYSGMCGDNLYWEYRSGNLLITGTGEMYDGTPWWLLCDSIYSVSLPNGITSIGNRSFSDCYNLVSITIPNTVTYIGNRAFADCIALTSITLPNSLTSIAYKTFAGCTALASVTIPGSVTFIEEYAFEECRKLRDIYCYAATPPTAQTNSFANYNVYVHVPCASLDAYDMDAVFGSFKYVECIGSEDADITDKTVTVVPGNADATFTWPITDGAETYTLVITKDGVTFCTLVFNKQGQLVSIAFKPTRQNAPAMDGTTPANYAEQTANGFHFRVTNLSEGTAYAYTLTVRDAANSILETYTGEFTTQSDIPMGIQESAGDNTPAGQAEKIFQNGQVLILRNGVTYDMMGQRL